jgi:hypothetical protein
MATNDDRDCDHGSDDDCAVQYKKHEEKKWEIKRR